MTHNAHTAQSPIWTRVLNALGLAVIAAALASVTLSGTTVPNLPLGSAVTVPAPTVPAPAPAAPTTATVTADAAVNLTAVKRSTKPSNGWKLRSMPINSTSERTLQNHRPKSGATVQRKSPKLKIRKSSKYTRPLVTR